MRRFLVTAPPRRGSRVGADFSIPVASLSPSELEEEQVRLTLQARSSFGAPPPPFMAWYIEDGMFHMPRFYGLRRYGRAEVEARSDGEGIALPFEGALRENQVRALDAAFGSHLGPDGDGGALISLPCGEGKTVWAVRAITRLARKACVLVHKTFLRDQWIETFRRFCPGVRVGTIQGQTWDVDGCDVVVAMVMTIAKRRYDPSVMRCFGTLCIDECHHMAAPVMNLAIRAFDARYIIGLSATKDRPDGLTPLLHWSIGPEAFRVERTDEGVRVTMAVFHGATPEISTREGRPLASVMLNKISLHPGRNRFLAARIARMRLQDRRVILVLSDRIKQLQLLRSMVLTHGVPPEDVGLFTGTTKEADRPEQLGRAVVFCSYGMANEGLNKAEADTCVMATPKARITQCVGRIQRPCVHKKPPLVLDVVDDVSIYTHMRWARARTYSKERYAVQVVPALTDPDDPVWFL